MDAKDAALTCMTVHARHHAVGHPRITSFHAPPLHRPLCDGRLADPSPRCAGQAGGGARLHGGADQLRPLRRGRPGADGGVAAGAALVRPRAGLVRPAARGDPQPVHSHARADEPDLRPRAARGDVRPVALHRQRRLADRGRHRDQVRLGRAGADGHDVYDAVSPCCWRRCGVWACRR